MKRNFVSLISLVAVLMFVGMQVSSFAQSNTNVGILDVQKVFKSYKETAKAQDKLSKEEAAFKKDFEDSQKQIEKAKASGKSEKEIEALTKKLEEALAPKRQNLIKLNESLTASIQNDIINATKSVAKNLGIDTVLDKQVVIAGGIDISDMVISKLNEKK